MKDSTDIALESGIEPGLLSLLESIALFYSSVNIFGDEIQERNIHITFSDAEETAYCSNDLLITLPIPLLQIFKNNKLPRLCIFYHELGHALYSKELFLLIDKWKNLSNNVTFKETYDEKYLHLINWIEDYYVESTLQNNYSYLTDVLKCLRLLPIKYDVKELDKAFNYYYKFKKITPALTNSDAIIFNNYIDELLSYRKSQSFGKGVISLINQNNVNFKYIKTLTAFYDWCMAMGIFKPGMKLPPLSLPTNILVPNDKQGNTKQSNIKGIDAPPNKQVNKKDEGTEGSSSDHTHLIGTSVKQTFPELDLSQPIFVQELETEQKYIDRYITTYRVETQENNLNGLFTNQYYDTSIIAKPNIKNFFDNRRLEDRMLFLMPKKTYNNVSIYRDVSGSTKNERFPLIDKVCEHLINNIPVDVHFYLYASGDISIVEVPYIKWTDAHVRPDEYSSNPDVRQLSGGTNSDAVADVISEQMDDKWLNIIVTDGDLSALFKRQNIDSLLNNIAIISIAGDVKDSRINANHYVRIVNENDICKIIPMLLNFKVED